MDLSAIKLIDDRSYLEKLETEENPYGGSIKTDYYWTADNKNQYISLHETDPVNFGIFSTSLGIGTDYILNTSRRKDKDVADINIKAPLTKHFSFKGRLRSKHWHDNLTGALRGGIEHSLPISDKSSIYTYVHFTEKMDRYGKSRETTGWYSGYSYSLSKESNISVEAEVYDFDDICKENFGFNLCYKRSF